MRDVHCHILPGVDDGARSMDESLNMLDAAAAVGVTDIVCTPHCRDPYFDYDGIRSVYREFKKAVQQRNPAMGVSLGFEVAHRKLLELGVGNWARNLAFEGTGELLLELDTGCIDMDFREYDRTIFQLQGMGLQIIIAHPERYHAIQSDVSLVEHLVECGCKLQASADFVDDGRFGATRRTAQKLFKQNLYTYLASDAHRVEHYAYLRRALNKYGGRLRS